MRKFTCLLVALFTMTMSFAVLQESYNYPTRGEDGRYALTNKWIASRLLGNLPANFIAETGKLPTVHGMAAYDGKMYLINSELEALIVVDGRTGQITDTIKIIGEHLFQIKKEDGTWSDAVTSKYRDVKFDSAGNCLIGASVEGTHNDWWEREFLRFFIYEVNLETGVATEVIKDYLWDDDEINRMSNFSFGSFGVNGDIHGDACIMTVDYFGKTYRWLITNGVVADYEMISITGYYNWNGTGEHAQICIADEFGEYFYVDGSSTYPAVCEFGGDEAEAWWTIEDGPSGLQIENNKGDIVTLQKEANGIQFFRVGDEYFLIMGATRTTSRNYNCPSGASALYRVSEDLDETTLEPLWYFPADGFGYTTKGVTVDASTTSYSVEVNANLANIYLYSPEIGYACYELKVGESEIVEDAVEDVVLNNQTNIQKLFHQGQLLILRNGKTYNAQGSVID